MKLYRAVTVLVALGALAACTSTSTREQATGFEVIEARAVQAEARGDLQAALDLYRQIADAATGAARAAALTDAARLALELGDRSAAVEWLRQAEPEASRETAQRITVLLAEIDLAEARPGNAIARVNQLGQPMPIAVMADAQGVRGRALFALGRAIEAVRELVERETWLDTGGAVLENQRWIWEGLGGSTATRLAPTGDPLVDGWLALAPVAASGVEGPALRGALVDWRRQHAGHPAAAGLLADLLSTGRADAAYPGQIALLLPISSGQRAAATAIRDGFIAAHLGARGQGQVGDASIRLYDTAQIGAEAAYQRAALEGAEFIVGPLLRTEVEQVIPQGGFVPTLALNFVDTDTSLAGQFWQFGLAPEDETRAIAESSFADGARTALVLAPATDWGRRMVDSFRAEFEGLGGRVLEHEFYETSQSDFRRWIEPLLNLDRSAQRHSTLESRLGIDLAFERSRRRQDVDMLFLAAPSREPARLLALALRFHEAGDLPTYAPSAIHEPSDSATQTDLNSLYFPDAPWFVDATTDEAGLRRGIERYWPARTGAGNLRLYGMGIDAYRLVGALYGGMSDWPVDGLTGQLELDLNGRVHRRLPIAQYRNGRPIPVAPAPVPVESPVPIDSPVPIESLMPIESPLPIEREGPFEPPAASHSDGTPAGAGVAAR